MADLDFPESGWPLGGVRPSSIHMTTGDNPMARMTEMQSVNAFVGVFFFIMGTADGNGGKGRGSLAVIHIPALQNGKRGT